MNSAPKSDQPYKTLGIRLKKVRQKYAQTLSEVSGSVEIDEKTLSSIESGKTRPSEDVLELLSNHYNLRDSEVIKLLELAGYSTDFPKPSLDAVIDSSDVSKTIIMLLSQDNKPVYSDGLDINYDANGILLNFKQSVGQTKPMSVAKVGMSYEQAEQVHKTLTRVLLHSKYLKGPRAIPKTTKKPKDI